MKQSFKTSFSLAQEEYIKIDSDEKPDRIKVVMSSNVVMTATNPVGIIISGGRKEVDNTRKNNYKTRNMVMV